MTEENGGRRIVDFGLWNADCGLKKDERREMKKTENPVERGKSEKGEAAPQAIAAMIRESRETGQLLSEDEIYRRVVDQQLLLSSGADSAEEVGTLLRKLVDESEDLQGMAAQDGSRSYYSSHFMTEAYARILILKRSGPRRVFAEIVRQNSAYYPRPVPLNTFTQPPFERTGEGIRNDLEQMQAEEEYRDIASTTTSSSRVLLYSTLHLETDHAEMLAEWLDVGQFENP